MIVVRVDHVPLVGGGAGARVVGGHHLGLLGVVAAVHWTIVTKVSARIHGLLQRTSDTSGAGATEDVWWTG